LSATEADLPAFVLAFSEWVEACWFAEHDAVDDRLRAVLGFPAEVVLVGSLSLLARLLQAFNPGADAEIAVALAEHLIITGPDPERQTLIRDVVLGAGADPPIRVALLARHGAEAVTRTALECASVLAQAMANRQGVVPSSILFDL
jgi:hypothetical protein